MFTGTLGVTRDEARRIVEELGGIAGSSVSRSTDYLVCGGDQVGKSNKWEKAGLLGVTRVDEDFFWDLVKEAKEEAKSEDEVIVHLSEEELENGITNEHWEVITRECPNLQVMTGGQFERLLYVLLPSYESPPKLKRLVEEYSIEVLPPAVCKFCGETIPYSIHIGSGIYYCFKCNQCSNWKEHHCIWFDPQVKQGYYMCKICGDFTKMKGRHLLYQRDAIRDGMYGSSVECVVDSIERRRRRAEIAERVDKMLEGVHVCINFVRDEERTSDSGVWLKCEVCGNPKFVGMDKFEAYWKKKVEKTSAK